MKLFRSICSMIVGVLALLLIALVAPMARADDSLPQDAKDAVERAIAGKMTQEDRELLIGSYPEVAATVPDAAATEVETSAAPESYDPNAQVSRCLTHVGSARHKSLLGFTIYIFTHRATVCADGVSIQSHSKPTYTMDNPDIFVEDWKVVDESVSGVGGAESSSRIQLRVRHCIVNYGCYASYYPTGTIHAKSNHTANVTTVSG